MSFLNSLHVILLHRVLSENVFVQKANHYLEHACARKHDCAAPVMLSNVLQNLLDASRCPSSTLLG